MATFQHSVYFWLKNNITDEQRSAFIDGCKKIGDSPNVASCRVGSPAGTDRPIVDNTYDVQLICGFNSVKDHDAYQSDADAVHQTFLDEHLQHAQRVVIYDSVEA